MDAAPPAGAPPPRFEEHFPREGLLGVLWRGHPYDALETYELLGALYGYRAAYVNYGHWPDGPATDEPGRRLALLAGDALALAPGARLLDVGSGLGQAAVDLARRHDLALVLGVNRSERQVGFANALARSEGLGSRIRHEAGDANAYVATLAPGAFDGILALECAGHLADADGFLRDARRALRPSGRIALTLNVARRPPSRLERALFRASYGFVPAAGEVWERRLVEAGFAGVERRDLTAASLAVVADVCLERLRAPSSDLRRIPWATRAWVALLFRAMRRAARRGALGYEMIWGRAG